MFDMKGDFPIFIQTPEGAKKILVRYPTDEEFASWRRKKKVVQKDLGRRAFQIEASKPSREDLELATALRKDENSPAIDEAEAASILARLAECEVENQPEREGSAFRIAMKVMRKHDVVHTLRVPWVKEITNYERMRSSVVIGAYGTQEIRINYNAGAELYDLLKMKVEGYTGEVPICHKAEAVNVLLQEIRSEQEEEPEIDEDQD
jgi:hypothetical protein